MASVHASYAASNALRCLFGRFVLSRCMSCDTHEAARQRWQCPVQMPQKHSIGTVQSPGHGRGGITKYPLMLRYKTSFPLACFGMPLRL